MLTTIRRVYLYAISFIAFEVLLWTAIGLAQLPIQAGGVGNIDVFRLAGLLSALIVAVPFYLTHWLMAQRLAQSAEEERTAGFRSFFHHLLLAVTLLSALTAFSLALYEILARLFGITAAYRDLTTNLLSQLIVAVISLIGWFYARRQKQLDDAVLPASGPHVLLQRIYRFLLSVVFLGMVAGGTGSLLNLLFTPNLTGAYFERYQLATGFSLMLPGIPLWYVVWRRLQLDFASGGEEAASSLRKAYLYLLIVVPALAVITSAATVFANLLQRSFGIQPDTSSSIATPLAIMIVGGVIWLYHSRVLAADLKAMPEGLRQGGVRRLYYYLLSAIGFAATLVGALSLIHVLVMALRELALVTLQISFSHAIAFLAAGVPVWLWAWLSVQGEALQPTEAGDPARRSLVRRGYLYLVAFSGALGLITAIYSLLNALLQRLLGARATVPAATIVGGLLIAGYFGAYFAYHLLTIRRDSLVERAARGRALAAFRVGLIADQDWAASFTPGLLKALHGLPLEHFSPDQPPPPMEALRAIVIPGSIFSALPGAWHARLAEFHGIRIIVPEEHPHWHWVGVSARPIWKLADQTAELLESAAVGEGPGEQQRLGPWAIVGLALAGLVLVPQLIAAILTTVTNITGP